MQLTENVAHRAATRRGCGLSWSPSQPKPAALAALWESALNTDDDLDFSPETMKQVRAVGSSPPAQNPIACLPRRSHPIRAWPRFRVAASTAEAEAEGGFMQHLLRYSWERSDGVPRMFDGCAPKVPLSLVQWAASECQRGHSRSLSE
jgi:hypothetical protein